MIFLSFAAVFLVLFAISRCVNANEEDEVDDAVISDINHVKQLAVNTSNIQKRRGIPNFSKIEYLEFDTAGRISQQQKMEHLLHLMDNTAYVPSKDDF